jgi:hypothetical protein
MCYCLHGGGRHKVELARRCTPVIASPSLGRGCRVAPCNLINSGARAAEKQGEASTKVSCNPERCIMQPEACDGGNGWPAQWNDRLTRVSRGIGSRLIGLWTIP